MSSYRLAADMLISGVGGSTVTARDGKYFFTLNMWAAMAHISEGTVVERGGVEVDVLPRRVAQGLKYAKARGWLVSVMSYGRADRRHGVVGVIATIHTESMDLGYYAYCMSPEEMS